MTKWIWYNSHGFGRIYIKKEGGKLDPEAYLVLNGKYPNPRYYTPDEIKELIDDGWSYEALCNS
jgi:hypothetical protein